MSTSLTKLTPGQPIPFGGDRTVYGFRQQIMGAL